MGKRMVIYPALLFVGVIFLAFSFSGKKNYFPLKGKVLKIEKMNDCFLASVKTDEGEEVVLKFVPGNGTNFTKKLFFFLEEGDTISVLVLEEEGVERTVYAILSVG